MTRTLLTTVAALALATSAFATEGTNPEGADDTAEMGVDAQGDITASRGADAPRATDELGIDTEGYVRDSAGYYIVGFDGVPLQIDFTRRAEAMDDEDSITKSRGAKAERAPETLMIDDDGYLMDPDGLYLVTVFDTVAQADMSKRAAGADDTALMGVDDDGNITKSRGYSNPKATETLTDS